MIHAPATDARAGLMAIVTAIVATRNRAEAVLPVLEGLRALPQRPSVVVIDNGSSDGTAAAVRRGFPETLVLALDRDLGSAAYTIGAAAAQTPLVAFSGDDSCWDPDSLWKAIRHFGAHSRLGLLAARVLLWPDRRPDPSFPLPSGGGCAAPVYWARACVARRTPFLEAGGFQRRLPHGAQERLLAFDLAAAGWSLAYAPDVTALRLSDPPAAPALIDEAWIAWLRRSPRSAWRSTARLMRHALREREARRALAQGLKGLPWLLRERRPVPEHLEQALDLMGL